MYYIYHIPNVKIGCTVRPKQRVNQQGYTDYEILEEHTCIDTVSKRELELQKEYGYPIDTSTYKESVEKNAYKQSIAGRISATKQWQENRARELEKCSKGGKIGGTWKWINSQKKECPYCKKEFGLGMYKRWHGNNCKKNPSKNLDN